MPKKCRHCGRDLDTSDFLCCSFDCWEKSFIVDASEKYKENLSVLAFDEKFTASSVLEENLM